MLDAYTTDGAYAFQFEMWEDIQDDLEDFGLEMDRNAFRPNDGVLIVLAPSGKGGWLYSKVVSGDELGAALQAQGLMPDTPTAPEE